MKKFNFPPASYQSCGLPQYDRNPLIAALPPILSDQETAALLKREIPYEKKHRHLPDQLRLHAIEISKGFFCPLPAHFDLAQALSITIRGGYLSRNPLVPQFWANLPDRREYLSANLDKDLQEPERSSGLAIIGGSGGGKSYAVERILRTYPQVIQHTEFGGNPLPVLQISWLKLQTPSDGLIKGLTVQFFAEVDNILGTDYARLYGSRRRTMDQMMADMATVASIHTIGCLVIDEVQHLQEAKHVGRAKMLNFFVEMNNTMNIPIILMGTPKAIGVLSSEFRSARRAVGQGAIYWKRMKNDGIWKHFAESLWKYQYSKQEVPLTDELSDLLYDLSQGITHLAVTIYTLAQRAVVGHSELLTPKVFHNVVKIFLQPAIPFLNALRTGDHQFLNMNDLDCAALNRHVAELKETGAMAKVRQEEAAPMEMGKPEKKTRGNRQKPAPTGLIASRARAAQEKVTTHDDLKREGVLLEAGQLTTG